MLGHTQEDIGVTLGSSGRASTIKNRILPQKRLYVHLATKKEHLPSYDYLRSKNYALLKIDSGSMVRDRYTFYCSGESVICTKIVPAEYVSVILSGL